MLSFNISILEKRGPDLQPYSSRNRVKLRPSPLALLKISSLGLFFLLPGLLIWASSSPNDLEGRFASVFAIVAGLSPFIFFCVLYLRSIFIPSLILDSEGVYPGFMLFAKKKKILWKDVEEITVGQLTVESGLSWLLTFPFPKRWFRQTSSLEYLSISIKDADKYSIPDRYKPQNSNFKLPLLVGSSGKVTRAGDLMVPSITLPRDGRKVLSELKKFPVKIEIVK